MHFKVVFRRFGAGVLFGCILTHSQPGKRFLTPYKPVKRYSQLRNSYQRKPKTGATPKTSPGATSRRGAGNPSRKPLPEPAPARKGTQPRRGSRGGGLITGAQPLPRNRSRWSRGAARPADPPDPIPASPGDPSRIPYQFQIPSESRKQSRKSKALPKVGRASKS